MKMNSLQQGNPYEGVQLRPSDIWTARYVTPYTYPRQIIDTYGIEEELAQRHVGQGRRAMATSLPDDHHPAIPVPESIEEKRVRELKQRRRVMLTKVYGTPDGLEVPPHRDGRTLEGIFDLSKEQLDDEKRERRAWTELDIRLPWKPPYEAPKPFPYHLKRLRWEKDWIEARQKEDRVFLFGNEHLDEANRSVVETEEPIESKLERWAEISQGRYFWDFVQHYPRSRAKHGTPKDELRSRRRLLVGRPETGVSATLRTRRVEGTKSHGRPLLAPLEYTSDEVGHRRSYKRHPLKPLEVTTEGKQDSIDGHLPSIFPFAPPEHKKKSLRNNKVSGDRLKEFGHEIDRLCSFSPIQSELHRWCLGTLGAVPEPPPRTKEIMSFFEEQLKPKFPPGLAKPFDELYPTLPGEALKKVYAAVAEAKAERRPTVVSVEGVTARREVTKVGGGRYAMR